MHKTIKIYGLQLFLSLGLCIVGSSAWAQFAKAEDAVKYRKAAFVLMGTHFSRIGVVVQGKAPFDAKALLENAQIIDALAKLPFTAFDVGTQGNDSKAKPEVWKEMDQFKLAANKMQQEVGKLHTAAQTGNLESIKAAFGAVAKTCKSCHEQYKNN